MRKRIVLWIIALLCNIGISQMPKDGFVSYNNQGEIKFNGETVITIKDYSIFAYSLNNGQLTVAVRYNYGHKKRNTFIYTIDLKSKNIIKEEQLVSSYTYRDSNIEFSIIEDTNDTNSAIMRYTRKGEVYDIALPITKIDAMLSMYYVSGDNYIVLCALDGALYVFSTEKKKFTHLAERSCYYKEYSDLLPTGLCIPLKEYVIYFMNSTLTNANVYLYNYAEGSLYATRYQYTQYTRLITIKDTIESNIKNGNIYEQFLPLLMIENIDSIVTDNVLRDSLWELLDLNYQRAFKLKDGLLIDIMFLNDKLEKQWAIVREKSTSILYFLDKLSKQRGNRDRAVLDSLLYLLDKSK
jgi:hypothetical protein